ncbi:MAG: hypothetical protein LBJ14_10270 [Desulfarculales bacterium]|jgi:hypothetical protein|nr:hypothetical protein [Desulfarculales bacterium]
MIEGLNIRCNIGPVELLRSPLIELVYKRRAVLTRALVQIPDSEGAVRTALAVGQTMKIRFGYRAGSGSLWHEWQGTVEGLDQPDKGSQAPDALMVRGSGLEKALMTTVVTESFYGETAQSVAKRLLSRTGLPVGAVDIPGDVLPHQVFSRVPVARAIKQLETTLKRAYGHDLSKYALWLGANGLMWSDGPEPGEVYLIETAHNLLDHTPPLKAGEMGTVVSVLLPGLTASRMVKIRDKRRGIVALERAEEVKHVLGAGGNSTTVLYGKQVGWG